MFDTCNNNPTIWLNAQALTRSYVGIKSSRAPKGCVQAAISVVAHDCELCGAIETTRVAIAPYDNFSIGLQDRAVPMVIGSGAEISHDFTRAIEGRIEATVRVVAHDTEVIVDTVVAIASDDDFSVGLYKNGVPKVT